MNALLDPLRQIARDLVQKKLWPVAALLVVALVAVPVVIGASAEDAPESAPVAVVAPPPPATGSLVTVVDQAVTGKDDRPGKIDDPFYDPPDPPDPEIASPGPATAAPVPSGIPAGPSGSPAGPSGTPPASTPPNQPAAPATESVHYRTVVRWYEAEGGKPRPISRLTPLGGSSDPAALYLGVTKATESYAVFLLGPNAISAGDAKCEDEKCRVIGLKTGQSQVVAFQPRDGGAVRKFHLDVIAVKAVEADSDTASSMRRKVHPDGREVMRALWQDATTAEALRPIQYSLAAGLLYKTDAAPAEKQAAK